MFTIRGLNQLNVLDRGVLTAVGNEKSTFQAFTLRRSKRVKMSKLVFTRTIRSSFSLFTIPLRSQACAALAAILLVFKLPWQASRVRRPSPRHIGHLGRNAVCRRCRQRPEHESMRLTTYTHGLRARRRRWRTRKTPWASCCAGGGLPIGRTVGSSSAPTATIGRPRTSRRVGEKREESGSQSQGERESREGGAIVVECRVMQGQGTDCSNDVGSSLGGKECA